MSPRIAKQILATEFFLAGHTSLETAVQLGFTYMPNFTTSTALLPYASSVRAGDFVFIAGQVPRDAARQVIGATIEEQTAAVFGKVRAALREQGASLDDVVKFQVFLADIDDWSSFNEEYRRQIGEHRPVRTTVGCDLNGVKIEIDATAYAPLNGR